VLPRARAAARERRVRPGEGPRLARRALRADRRRPRRRRQGRHGRQRRPARGRPAPRRVRPPARRRRAQPPADRRGRGPQRRDLHGGAPVQRLVRDSGSGRRGPGRDEGAWLMTDMVRAAVQVAPRTIELRAFPRPTIGPDDGLLRVEANGICGSDVESYRGHLGMGRGPTIPGHEPMGIVEEVGERAAERWGVQPGDRVALEVIVPCRSCHDCLTGRYQACRHRKYGHGVTGIDVPPSLWGGFAEHLYLTPGAVLHKIDKTLPAELAVMFNPLGAGVRWAVHLGEVGLGDTVRVRGAGQRGLACVIAARAAGAGTIIVTGLEADAHKLALAKEFGADHTIVVDGPDAEDTVERVREITDGEMA